MLVGKRILVLGFTLIELLVTIAVAVVLATVAVPGFQGVMKSNRLSADFNEVISVVYFARSEAVALRKTVSVEFSGEEDRPWLAEARQGNRVIMSRQGSDARVGIIAAPQVISFNSLGRSLGCSSGCAVSVGGKEGPKIVVEASGRILRGSE